MIFSSLEFFVFLGLLLAVLSLLRGEGARRNLLLLGSYVFYGWWDWRFCGLILFSTVVDYLIGRRLGTEGHEGRRRALLVTSVAVNLGLLATFKYANFFLDSLRALLGEGVAPGALEIVLPVGISFYTFQTLSYTIDVWRRRLEPTADFRDFALFVSFFPQLVAGPIVRGSEFLPQLRGEHPLRRDQIVDGAGTFVTGFVKKVLFADTLAVYVDPVFADPGAWSPWTCRFALLAYAGQIYYDFSGYSQMAIGVGRMLGFTLPENFRHPYNATSITDFWRRWHITLSAWLRDYLYIPLGGNRHGEARTWVNLFVTMLLGGLWHGASWNFVAWGGLHGLGLAVHKLWGQHISRGWSPAVHAALAPLSWALTFAFTCFAWVFFRAANFGVAREYLGQLVADGGGVRWFRVEALVVLAAGAAIHLAVAARRDRELGLDLRQPGQAALAVLLLLLVLLYAPFGTNPFIYFQF